MMINQKFIAKYLIESKNERPLRGLLRNLIFSLLFTIIVIIFSIFFLKEITYRYLLAVLIISCFIFYFGWGTERLWYAYISPITKMPYSFRSYLTRIPLWFISGGVALSFSTLLVYKFYLIDIISWTKQYLIFMYGGLLNIILQIPLQFYTYYNTLRKIKQHNYEKENH